MPAGRRTRLVLGGALVAVAGAAVVVGAAAVGGDGPSERERSRAATERPCGREYVDRDPVVAPELGLTARLVAKADQPAALAVDPLGRGPMLLAQREGEVVVVDDTGAITDEVVLDLSDDTLDHGDGGLLGLAYDPEGGWLYAYRADAAADDVVSAFPLRADGRPDPAAEVELLRSGHGPSEQHHGGAFGFGPDGMLYVGFGDGGGLGDPEANAQDTSTLLGKLLRIDPTPGADEPYAIPPDNPFVGDGDVRPEIWAVGVRNPYRLSFDTATGDLWLVDVGQSCWDEVNRLTAADAGGNLGWDHREGTAPFQGGDVPGREIWPLHVTAHSDGWCAIVGGYVVRSPELPAFDGWFLFTDYCNGSIHALHPSAPGQATVIVDTGVRLEDPIAIVPGPNGLPWALTLAGSVVELTPR